MNINWNGSIGSVKEIQLYIHCMYAMYCNISCYLTAGENGDIIRERPFDFYGG